MNISSGVKTENTFSCSVIIRTKDRPNQLGKSLNSLRRQIRQPDDIIVVNDGGQRLDAVIEQFPDLSLTCLNNDTNQGRSIAGNIGVENARGDAVCFLDDDDIFFEDHIQRLALCMQKFDAKVAYSGCVLRQKDLLGEGESPEQSAVQGEFNEPFDPDRLRFENYIPLITLIIEKSLFQQVGGFDDRFNLFEDWDLLLRLSQKTRFYHLDRITTEYTLWGKSQQITLASQTDQWQDAYSAVFNKHFLPLSPEDKTRFMADYWIKSQDRRSQIQALQKELSRQETISRQYLEDARKYQDCARDLQNALAYSQQMEQQINNLKKQARASAKLIETTKKQNARFSTLRDLIKEQECQDQLEQDKEKIKQENRSPKTPEQVYPCEPDILAEQFHHLCRWIQARNMSFKTIETSLARTHESLQVQIRQIGRDLEQINQVLNAFWVRQKICRPATILLAELLQKKDHVSQMLNRTSDVVGGFQPLLLDPAVPEEPTEKAVIDCSPLYELYAFKNGAFNKVKPLAYDTTTHIPMLPGNRLRFTIYCTSDRLARIDLVFGTYARINTCQVTLNIFDDRPLNTNEPPLRTIAFNAMDVINNHCHPIVFDPIAYAGNRPFRVEIQSANATQDEHIALWCHEDKSAAQLRNPSHPQLMSMTTHMQTDAWLAALVKHLPLTPAAMPERKPDHIFAIHIPLHDPITGIIAGTREQMIPMILVQLNHLVRKQGCPARIILFGQTSRKMEQYCRTNHLTYVPFEPDDTPSEGSATAPAILPDNLYTQWILTTLLQDHDAADSRCIWLLDGTWLVNSDVIVHAENIFAHKQDAAMILPMVHNACNTVFHGFGQMTDTGQIVRLSSMMAADHPGNRYGRNVTAADTPGFIIRGNALAQMDLAILDTYQSIPYQITELIWQLTHHHQKTAWFDSRMEFMAREPRQAVFSHGLTLCLDTALKEDADCFRDRWEKHLNGLPGAEQPLFPLLNAEQKTTALVIDDKMPTFDEDSGALRMFEILRILTQLDIRVSFFPSNRANTPKYRHALENLGIEVFCSPYDIHDALLCREYDFIVISRVAVAYQHINLLKKACPAARLYYDTVDIHYIREFRQAEIEENQDLHAFAKKTRQKELSNAIQADVVFTVTEEDKHHLQQEIPALHCFVLPNIHRPQTWQLAREKREGLVFIGNYNHQPNVDAVFYFVEHVFPLILKQIPNIRLYLVGSHMKADMKALASDNIQTLGWVEQVEPVLVERRVMVSYLRYGAGMKGKIGQAMSLGLPVVSTTIGAEGMGLTDGENALVADGPDTFARKVCELYTDQSLWETIAGNARAYIIDQYGTETVKNRLHDFLKTDLGQIFHGNQHK